MGLSELNLTGDGYIPRVDTMEATSHLDAFQVPEVAVTVQEGSTTFWAQAKTDHFSLLSISDLAFLTMFNEGGTIEGGRQARDEEYGSEQLYGAKKFSNEPEDVVQRGG